MVHDPKLTYTEDFVLFYGGWPSNFYRSKFTIDGIEYWCGEQWMMSEKARAFGDQVTLAQILGEKKKADVIKRYGRSVRPFNSEKWSAICRDRLYEGLIEKFRQNNDLKLQLLETGNRNLVECSKNDRIWGIGREQSDPRCLDPKQWDGTNWLGEVLMRVRDTLKDEKKS